MHAWRFPPIDLMCAHRARAPNAHTHTRLNHFCARSSCAHADCPQIKPFERDRASVRAALSRRACAHKDQIDWFLIYGNEISAASKLIARARMCLMASCPQPQYYYEYVCVCVYGHAQMIFCDAHNIYSCVCVCVVCL